MAGRKYVNISLDTRFYNMFEKARQKEQERLRKKFGNIFNLSQSKFSLMIAQQDPFKFLFPPKKTKRGLKSDKKKK